MLRFGNMMLPRGNTQWSSRCGILWWQNPVPSRLSGARALFASVACSRSPSPLPSPIGRGSRVWLSFWGPLAARQDLAAGTGQRRYSSGYFTGPPPVRTRAELGRPYRIAPLRVLTDALRLTRHPLGGSPTGLLPELAESKTNGERRCDRAQVLVEALRLSPVEPYTLVPASQWFVKGETEFVSVFWCGLRCCLPQH